MKPITNLFIAGLLLLAFSLSGQTMQTTITPATASGAIGAQIDLQVKVTGFTNVISLQFPITYNQAVLQFVSADGFTLPGFLASNYNANTPGRIVVSWFPDPAQYPNGYTAPSGTSIMTLHFTVIANGTTAVNLASNVPAAPIEVINAQGQEVTVNFQSGGSSVTGGSGGPPPVQGFKIMANTISIPKDSTRCMPVTVNDFNAITLMQYAMHWNTSVLQYVNTKAYTLPGLTSANFGGTPATGTQLLSWYDQSQNLSGATMPNGAKIYEVCFKGVGAAGSSSMVTIDGVGFPSNGTAEAYSVSGGSTNLWTSTTGVADTLFVVAAPPPPPPPNAVTFTVVSDTVSTGTQVCIPITVANFTSIVSAQFGISYNATQLQFQSLQLGNPVLLPGLAASNFNTTTAGIIKFSWLDPNVAGVNLPDSTVIFTICFTVAAPAGTVITVTIGSVPGLAVEVAKEPGGPITPSMVSGSVTVSDVIPCTATANITHVKCNNGSDGAITLTPTPANCQVTSVSWSGPSFTSTNQNISGLKAGVYNVTITWAGGNTSTATHTVNQPQALSATAAPVAVTCPGGNNGSINLTVTGGTAPFTFAWSGSATGEDPANLTAANYLVTITDANQCTHTPAPILVSQPNQISITPQVTNIPCFGGTSGAVNLTLSGGTPGGNPAYTVSWSGPNGYTSTAQNISNLTGGIYTATVTDAAGCSRISQPIQVVQPGSALNAALTSVLNAKCFNEASGGANITITGGASPYGFVWRNFLNQTVSMLEDPTGLAAGIYSVVVTDNLGCSQTINNVTINGPAQLFAVTSQKTDVKCFGSANGTIDLSAAGGWPGAVTYAWSNGLPATEDQANLLAGTYNVTATDAGGCSVAIGPIALTAPALAITLSSTTVVDVSCADASDGSIIIAPVGGNGAPWTVNWLPNLSGTFISNLEGGLYTPIVKDKEGCEVTFPAIQVDEPLPIDLLTITIIDQNGVTANGEISLSVTGGTLPITYTWSGPGINNQTTMIPEISNLVAGNYTVTISDANGCSRIETLTVGQLNPISMTATTKGSCNDDGCINLTMAGAVLPVTATLSGPTPQTVILTQLVDTICGLTGGFYNVNIVDFLGNSFTVTNLQVAALAPPVVGFSFSDPIEDNSNGQITLFAVPANAPLSYQWSYQNATGNQISGLDEGTYYCTITHNVSGCQSIYPFTLVRKYDPASGAFTTVAHPSCLTNPNGSINFTFTGGADPYTFHWEGPGAYVASTEDISGLSPGLYQLTVTDDRDSLFLFDTVLTAQSLLAISTVNESAQASGFTECDGAATVVFTNAVGNISVQWSNNISGITNAALCPGPYSVTVTDGLGCQSVWYDEISSPDKIEGNLQVPKPVSCHGVCDAIARLYVTGGVAPYTVVWPNGQTDFLDNSLEFSDAANICGGTYVVTITDANGVTSSAEVVVDEPDPLTIAFQIEEPERFSACDGKVVASVNSAFPTSFVWSSSNNGSGNTASADGLCAGEFVEFIAQDSKGCTAVGEVQVPYPADGCLQVRSVLTPGTQDGKNDFLLITCTETVTNTIEIYNRWGQLVYQTDNYDNVSKRWNGLTNAGDPLPEGVYFFVLTYIDVDGNSQQLKGHVNLLR